MMTDKERNLYIPPGRATGKTFRILLSSLSSASAGDCVYYIQRTTANLDNTFHHVYDILQSFQTGINDPVVIQQRGQHIVKFPNGGKLIFATEEHVENRRLESAAGIDRGKLKFRFDFNE